MWQLGKDTSHVPNGFEYPKGGRLELDGDSEGQSRGYEITSLQTIPCHIVGMQAFFCLKRKLYLAVGWFGRTCGHIALACK